MIPIKKNLANSGKYSIKCPYSMTPTRIVIHNTGNDASAAGEVKYMLERPEKISFHYAVDDKEAVQGVLDNRNTWNANDGNGEGNRQGISIEICYSLSGGDRFIKAEKNAAILTAYLLKKYGWGIAQVTKHQDYSGKYCPHRTLNMGWQRFLNMVSVELTNLKGELTMAQYEELKKSLDSINKTLKALKKDFDAHIAAENARATAKCPSWGKKPLQDAINKGIVKGDGKTTATPDNVRPLDYVTRLEAVIIAERTMKSK
jgi:N-acetylmuramoyl-L-alanine amidase